MQIQNRTVLGRILAIGVLFFLIVGITVNQLWHQSSLGLLRAKPEIPEMVRLVPSSAQAVVILSAPLQQLRSLTQGITPSDYRVTTGHSWHTLLSSQNSSWIGTLFRLTQADFTRDIVPWLGQDMVLAFLGSEPGSLLVLSTQDLSQSSQWLDKLAHPTQGVIPESEIYKGVRILSDPSHTWAVAAFSQSYLLLANHPHVIQEAIDGWQLPQFALPKTSAYQRLLPAVTSKLSRSWVGWVYLKPNAGPLKGLSFSLEPLPTGLATQVAALWEDTLTLPAPGSQDLLKVVPAQTQALMTGQDPGTFWQKVHTLGSISGLQADQILQKIQAQTHLDWQTDLFSWLKQDYALGLLKSDPEYPEWFLVAKLPKETRTVEATLNQKMNSLGFTPVSLPLSNKKWGTATTWVPQSGSSNEQEHPPVEETQGSSMGLGYHLLWQGRFYLASSLSTLEQVLGSHSLKNSYRWKHATVSLPPKNQGYLYWNLKAGSLGDSGSDNTQLGSLLEGLQSLGIQPPETLTLATTEWNGEIQKGRGFLWYGRY
jgi:hypothetical protein